MNNTLVSIIMPVHNSEKYLNESINSVLLQTYKNWELLVTDDCSTDGSKKIIETYALQDSRIIPIYLQVNSGAAIARNTAIKKAQGKYIAFLDADDLWKSNKLEKHVKFMLDNKIAFSFTGYEILNSDGFALHKIIKCPKTVTYTELLKYNSIGCLTAMYDADILGKQFMPDIKKRQDYGLWLTILKTGIKGYGMQEILSSYRTSGNSLSGNKLQVLKYNWIILRRHQHFNFFKSLYYFSFFLYHKSIKYFFNNL